MRQLPTTVVLLAGLLVACAPPPPPAAKPAPPAPWADNVRAGDRAFDAGQWPRAAAAYDAALQQGASALRIYVRRAELYRRTGDLDAGLQFLVNAIDIRGWHAPQLYDQRIALLAAAGRDDDAQKLADRVAAMKGDLYEADYMLCHRAQPDIARCADFLRLRPEREAGRDSMPLAAVALELLAKGKAAEALARFEELQRRFPDDDIAQRNAVNGLCAAHAALGQTEEAIAACKRAADETDDNAAAYYNLAATYLAAGDVDSALVPVDRYAAAVSGGGKTRRLFLQIATLDARRGRWIQCVFAWLRAQAPELVVEQPLI